MQRDTSFKPMQRSINGVERPIIPARPVPVVPPRAEPRVVLIDDFHRKTISASERVVTSQLGVATESELHTSPLLTQMVAGTGAGNISLSTPSSIEPVEQVVSEKTHRIRDGWIKFGIPIVAALLLITGGIMAVLSIKNNLALQEQVETYAATATDSGETTTPATAPASTVTDPRAPKHISIDSIAVSTSMTTVGVNTKGNIGAPANIKQASWYTGSDSPIDSKGDAMIVAHVGTDRYAGAFAKLHETKVGDIVTLTMGDDKKVTYRITSSEDVTPEAMDVARYIGAGADHEGMYIHLVTCTGDYNARTKTYTHRLIVTAERVGIS